MPGAITVITIASVIVVTLSQLHPGMLLTNTTTTGGDTGAHIAMPKFLESLLVHGHLTGWDPGWYDGFPLYTFYFTIPDLFIAIGGWIIPYGVAFKLGTILGSVILPICAWACGRFFRLRAPLPAILAAATLPFLFDYTFTIYGGNLFSTLAGEYAYSFSLSLAVLFLGLFACAVREGRYRGWTALVLAVCILSHMVGGLYALGGAAILTLVELLPARWGIGDSALQRGVATTPRCRCRGPHFVVGLFDGRHRAVALRVVARPLRAGARVRVVHGVHERGGLGPVLPRSRCLGSRPGGDRRAHRRRDAESLRHHRDAAGHRLRGGHRRGPAGQPLQRPPAAAVVHLGLPDGRLGVRDLVRHCGDGVAAAAGPSLAGGRSGALGRARRFGRVRGPRRELPDRHHHGARHALRPTRRWGPAAVTGAILGLLAVMVAVVPPFILPASSLPVTVGPNQVTNWSSFNYEGYQGQASYPEFHSLMETMGSLGKRYGCGRAMWEYSASENRFGTPEALMLLPFETNGCIDSMEGLLFESSATTPYHFLNQAELSAGPSEPEVGLPYGPLDVTLGVQHLQLLGVKYFMAETPQVEQEAAADPDLQLVAESGPWTYNYSGADTTTTWQIYLVKDSPLVTPLANDPVVLSGVKPGPSSWLGTAAQEGPSLSWYADPSKWNVELAQSGPSDWPRTSVSDVQPTVKHVGTTKVSAVTQTDSSVSFHVSRVGTPVLVKVSYFPNWQATGPNGPWRVTPNLMVVVPTSHDVTLTYGDSAANHLGQLATLLGLVALVMLFVVPTIRQWWRRLSA